MSIADYLTQPADPISVERMKAAGLRMALVDTSNEAEYSAWWDALNRGFHGGANTPERRKEMTEGSTFRRAIGIWDDTNSNKFEPVATIDSWPTRLAVPGGQTIQTWAISGVTVASTHSGRGIARAMLEGELRTATELGMPMASLTVSESSLYGRYGFAPAAMAADYEFDVRRVTWNGPVPDGRVEYISNEQFRDLLAEMHERLLPTMIGEIDLWPLRTAQIAGTALDEEGGAKKLRAIQYLDADGVVRGIANYKISGGDHDFMSHALSVEYLLTETPDAYAALWRYLLSVPLVEKVTAAMRSVDEPVRWMITDWRAATVKTWEHQYLRVLDVKACWEARRYGRSGTVAFHLNDELDLAAGSWSLSAGTDGVGHVGATSSDGGPGLTLGAAEFSALFLGGVRPSTLAEAGRLVGSEESLREADLLLGSPRVPYLSIWY